MKGTIEAKVVSNNMKSARVKKGLLQADVAEYLGISRQQFSVYENNPENLKLKTYMSLAELYEVPVTYFFGL